MSTTVMAEGEDEKDGLATLFKITLTRPIRFLVSEPIILFSAVYNGFTFAIVYLFQGSFALIFGSEGHGWNLGEQGLSFLGLLIGTLVGALINPIQDRYYLRRIREEGKGVPEARMWMAMAGSFLFPISLFWFAWTSYASIPWIVPMIASGFFGLGFYIVLQALLSYLYDAYGSYCSSGYASLLLVRNWMGCFPLFADPM